MKRLAATVLAVFCLFVLLFPMGPSAMAADSSSTAGYVTTVSTSLTVRSEPAVASAAIGSLANGSTVTLLGKSGNWWHVELAGGKTGYCYASYITQAAGSEAMKVATESTALNIRSGPSASYGVQAKLAKGTTVVKLSVTDGFAKILYNGTKLGYASLKYLSAAGGSSAASATYTAVSLSVPDYKQTDNRWVYVKVGDSGKTIGQIGCATTCLAMTESYRTGASVTPDIMESRLSYTSAGALYWPSGYAMGGSMSYIDLYNKLKNGITVIVGAKNANGDTHFVVVTGYTGGDTLKASGFTINDPGSNSRTTLSQYLAVYPSIYRTVYAK